MSVDVFTEGRICENVVDDLVRDIHNGRRTCVHYSIAWNRYLIGERFLQAFQFTLQIVPRRHFGVLRGNIVDTRELTIDLRIMIWSVSIHQ